MRRGSATSCVLVLVLLLLLPLVCAFALESVNSIKMGKVVDPFLIVHGRSADGTGRQVLSGLVTSLNPLTPLQRTKLGSYGTIRSTIGRVTTMQVYSDELAELVKLDFVSGVFSPRSFHPTLDISAQEIGATFVWQNITDASGRAIDGSGVIIGTIDTGVDLAHPDLKFPNGTSKVLYLWDQTLVGKPPHGFNYGVECTWNEINSGECREDDAFGHGTHVASIAASSGLASGKFRGIAPGAYLIVVKGGSPLCNGENWTFDEQALIEGMDYLVEKARMLRMRLVINLSLGGNLGGHDDTSPLELVIDDLTAQGVAVVVSSGNEADNRGHAAGSLDPTKPTQLDWGPVGGAKNIYLDLWHPSDGDISATLVTPSGDQVHGPTPGNGTGTGDGIVTILSLEGAKGRELLLSVQAEKELHTSGWSLLLSAPGTQPVSWDAWVDSDSCSYPAATFQDGEGYTIEENGTVSVPATATGAIAVGAYVTKNSWINKLGKSVVIGDYDLGDLAPFSSQGPTRDGRTKPDVTAPGLYIAGARSLEIPPSDGDPDQYHRVLAGTSMAAPHVAGVVALMLQYRPGLTPEEVRSVLIAGADLDAFTQLIDPSTGSNEWGWGKTDARTATGLFRVCSTLLSLPAAFSVNLIVDGVPHASVRGGQFLTLRFFVGSSHIFEVVNSSFTANSTRYVIAADRAIFTSNGVFEPTVRVQYMLSLKSLLSETQGEGWYDAGSYASFAVSANETSRGLAHLLGITFSFDYWVDERGNRVYSGRILMDSPHTLRAVWRARLADLRPILLLVATMLLLTLIIIELDRRKAHVRAA